MVILLKPLLSRTLMIFMLRCFMLPVNFKNRLCHPGGFEHKRAPVKEFFTTVFRMMVQKRYVSSL